MTAQLATLANLVTGEQLDLTDQAAGYFLLDDQAPNPDGDTRRLKLQVLMGGTSSDELHAREHAIRRWLDTAKLWQDRRWGRYLALSYQPDDASAPAIADVLKGDLESKGWRDGQAQSNADILRLALSKDIFDLTLTCAKYLRGNPITLAAQVATNRPAGIEYRYVFDDSGAAYVNTTNIAGQAYGRLFSTARDDSAALTVAVNDYVALGDPTGRFTRLSGGVDIPLAHTGAVWALQYKAGAGAWTALAGVTLFNDAFPSGVPIANLADAFTRAGPFELRWDDPGGGWASNSQNSQTAYWVRLIVTTLGTVTTYPTLAYGPLRSPRGLVLIPAAQVPGDAPAAVAVTATNSSGAALRQVRMALAPSVRRGFGIPVHRHQAEYASVGNAGSVDTTTFTPSTIRGGAVLKVGSATTDFAISFDGVNDGYLDFGTTPTALANLSLVWTIDFFLEPYADPDDPSRVSGRPQPIFGSWDIAGSKRKLLVLLENGRLTLLLSRNGTDVVRYGQKYTKKGATQANEAAWMEFTDPTPLAPGGVYFCRVQRSNANVQLGVAQLVGGRLATLSGSPIKTIAPTGKLDALGTNPLYTTTPAAFRLGKQVGITSGTEYDDFEGGAVRMLNGRVEQLRVRVDALGPAMTNQDRNTGEVTAANDTGNKTIGLYLFNDTPGRLVNSQTTATPNGVMATPTRSATYPVDVAGLFDKAQRLALHSTLRLPWWLADSGRGRYRVYAIARSPSSVLHGLQVSQGGYYLTPSGRSLTATGAWQAVDVGRAQVPYQQVGGGYSPLGGSVDRAEDLGIHVANGDVVQADIYIDELVTLPEDWWRVAYDCGPTSTRWLDVGESLVLSSVSDPPQAGQLDTAGRLQPNPERGGHFGTPPQLLPGVDSYILVDLSRGTNLESNLADTVDVVVVVEPRFVSKSALP